MTDSEKPEWDLKIRKIDAEISKLNAETAKLLSENRYYPLIVGAGLFAEATAFAATLIKVFI